MFKSLCIQSC